MLPLLAALAAAMCFAGSSVAQHVAASRAPVQRVLSPRLLLRLVRDPVWVLAFPLDALGVTLQGVALRLGTLLVVQPVVAIGLVLAVPMRALVNRRRPAGRQMAAVVVCTVALAVLLSVLRPSAGHLRIAPASAVLGFCGISAVSLLLAVAGMRRPAWAAGTTAAAAGLLFGACGVLLKLAATALAERGLAALTTWPPYLLAVFGAAGLLLSQNAFQAGSLAFPLAVITVVEPLTSIVLAVWLLGERTPLGGARAGTIAVAGAVLFGGLVYLSLTGERRTA